MALRTAEQGPGNAISVVTRGCPKGGRQKYLQYDVSLCIFFTVPPPVGAKKIFTVALARGPPTKIYSSHAGVQCAALTSEQKGPRLSALPVAKSSWWTSLEPLGCWGRGTVLTYTFVWQLQKQPSTLIEDKHQVLGGRSKVTRQSQEISEEAFRNSPASPSDSTHYVHGVLD